MTFQEDLARVRANLERLKEFGNAYPWLISAMSYYALYPSDRVPTIRIVCRDEGFPKDLRPRLMEIAEQWKRESATNGKFWHWEATTPGGVEIQIIAAEPRPDDTKVFTFKDACEEVA